LEPHPAPAILPALQALRVYPALPERPTVTESETASRSAWEPAVAVIVERKRMRKVRRTQRRGRLAL
jgi:hypothetical protein